MKRKRVLSDIAITIFVLFSISACTSTPTPYVSKIDPCAPDVLTAIASAGAIPRCDHIPTSKPAIKSADIYCSQTVSLVGEQVNCRMNTAYCSFQPGTDGSPTFCNDNPYPDHNFIMVVWGEDWSDYNGLCLEVKGVVSTFDGKPQIIVTDRSQVRVCPPSQ